MIGIANNVEGYLGNNEDSYRIISVGGVGNAVGNEDIILASWDKDSSDKNELSLRGGTIILFSTTGDNSIGFHLDNSGLYLDRGEGDQIIYPIKRGTVGHVLTQMPNGRAEFQPPSGGGNPDLIGVEEIIFSRTGVTSVVSGTITGFKADNINTFNFESYLKFEIEGTLFGQSGSDLDIPWINIGIAQDFGAEFWLGTITGTRGFNSTYHYKSEVYIKEKYQDDLYAYVTSCLTSNGMPSFEETLNLNEYAQHQGVGGYFVGTSVAPTLNFNVTPSEGSTSLFSVRVKRCKLPPVGF